MYNNSSSALDALPSASNSSIPPFYLACQQSIIRNVIYTLYAFTNALFLLPLYILILYMGFKRWRRQRSTSAERTMSHFDFFTYNMMIPEIICVFGAVFYTLGTYIKNELLFLLGVFFFCVILPGQTLFHVLTCVERYLAVVHPVTYMRLREADGIRIRNIITVCAWLLCFVWVGVIKLYLPKFPTIPFFSFLGICIFVTFFCCLAVLRGLTLPGPGEAGNHKQRGDQSKQRAFYIISAITVTLLLRSVGLLLCFGLEHLVTVSLTELCELLDSGIWLTVPSSLILPLLFLYQAGKLPCCKRRLF